MTENEVSTGAEEKLVLQLFISGMSLRSMEAIDNLNRLCKNHIDEPYELEIIDLYHKPDAAQVNHIVFSPSLVKKSPLPRRTVIGTLSDMEKVIRILGIKPKK